MKDILTTLRARFPALGVTDDPERVLELMSKLVT